MNLSTNNPTPTSTPKPRIGVALGGGSARGYAHIGALASLEHHGLAPEVVAGTSFGALIGALYAAGQSTDEIAAHANRLRRRDLMREVCDFGLHRAALFRGDKLEAYFDTLLEGRSFADLQKEFVIVTTDVDTGERVLIGEGSIARALRASVALPGLFAPVSYLGHRLVDGGLASPIPLDTLNELEVDIAIGIGAGIECQDSGAIRLTQHFLKTGWGQRVHAGMRDTTGVHPVQVLGRALAHTATSWEARVDDHGDRLHVQTKPPISWLNFHKAALAITAGEEALNAFIPTIKQAVEQLQLPLVAVSP